MLIALHKPYGVLSQFTAHDGKRTLADLVDVPGVYAAGRLDFDSEGLLLLTDDGRLQQRIADPARRLVKRYWAQVEGIPDPASLALLAAGVTIGNGVERYRTGPASVESIQPPALPARDPPIRERAHIPTSWLSIGIAEGRNRQVRRMTAAIGHPCLRLVRVAIGPFDLVGLGLMPGAWRAVDAAMLAATSRPGRRQVIATSRGAFEPMSTGALKRR